MNTNTVHHLEISESDALFFFLASPASLLFILCLLFSDHCSLSWRLQSPHICRHNCNYHFFPVLLQFCQHDHSQFESPNSFLKAEIWLVQLCWGMAYIRLCSLLRGKRLPHVEETDVTLLNLSCSQNFLNFPTIQTLENPSVIVVI